ncbi:hypothetical protein M5D96_012110 [Drosophila gunungcola]|uniref:Uncharacterized protein n=1 Tax=Drosophila gunungcola TaxID=103775 RepID=A0A9P9YEL2_9MUSC|nr:hypothetical protein M5D96_012110 [Drosophila gunungcola]
MLALGKEGKFLYNNQTDCRYCSKHKPMICLSFPGQSLINIWPAAVPNLCALLVHTFNV